MAGAGVFLGARYCVRMAGFPDTLELIVPPDGRVKVAELTISEPIEKDGTEYRTITLTAAFCALRPATPLRVVDAADDDKLICAFVAESISMFLRGEQFIRIDGKQYLRFPSTE